MKSIQDSALVICQFYFLERRRVRIVPALILLQATALRSCVGGGNGNGSAAASTAARSLLVPSISSSSTKHTRESRHHPSVAISISFRCVVSSLIFF